MAFDHRSREPATWRPRRREEVVFRRVGEDWLLFDPRTQRIHVLNLTSALVWSFCEGDHRVSEIEERVRAAFRDEGPSRRTGGEAVSGEAEVSPARAALRRFLEEGLLEEPPGTAAG